MWTWGAPQLLRIADRGRPLSAQGSRRGSGRANVTRNARPGTALALRDRARTEAAAHRIGDGSHVGGMLPRRVRPRNLATRESRLRFGANATPVGTVNGRRPARGREAAARSIAGRSAGSTGTGRGASGTRDAPAPAAGCR